MLHPKVDVDDIWRGLGWGLYQKWQFAINLVNIWPTGFHLLSVVFIGTRSPFQCKEIDDFSQYLDDDSYNNNSHYVKYDKCEIDVYINSTNGSSLVSTHGCLAGYTYSVPKDRSFVSEWDLVCSNAGYAELSQTLVMIGQAFGAGTAAPLADRFGRKTICLISHLGIFAVGLAISFMPYFTGFAVLRFLVGTFQQGIVLTTYIIKLEMVSRDSRYWTLAISNFFWTTGLALVTPVAYSLREYSWRYFQLTITLYSVYALLQYWIQDESVRWLVINNKLEEAERIIRKAAKWNKVRYEDVMEYVQSRATETSELVTSGVTDTEQRNDKQENIDNSLDVDVKSKRLSTDLTKPSIPAEIPGETPFKVKHYTIMTLLKDRRILIISLILWLTWITNSLTYFGLILTSNSLAGSRFLNFFLNVIVEYPAALMQYLLINRIGRKSTCILFHLIAGLSLIAATVLKYFASSSIMIIFSTVFSLVGKLGITGSFGTLFLYTPELYPTNLRNAGIGFSSSASRIGGMLSPFAGTLATYAAWGPGTIFSAMCMVVSALFFYLPETSGHELPQTMEEVKVWYKGNSGTSKKKEKKTSTV